MNSEALVSDGRESRAGWRVAWAAVVAIVSAVAWLVLWTLNGAMWGLGDLVDTVLRFGGSRGRPPSFWFHLGLYGQWLYGAVAVLVVVAVLRESRRVVTWVGIWFGGALLLAVTGYLAFDGSVGTVFAGVTPVGLASMALVVRARSRAA